MPIQVSIVEDDARIRQSLQLLIESSPAFSCLGVYPNAEEALRLIPQRLPDVVLMDINLPRMSGVECVARLKATLPKLLVVMLTVYDDSDQIFGALQAGANGYLLKRTPPDEIIEAIQDVAAGGAPMSSFIARKVVQSFHKARPAEGESVKLTPREEAILSYVAKGYINKEIAETLAISLETVRSHLKNIYDKLHVRSRTEAAMRFFKSG